MSKMYNHLKKMMTVADTVGDVTGIDMGEWLDKYDRISIRGTTQDGHSFELALEVKKEVEQDA